ANPSSTRAALDTLASLKGERRGFAILGDMLELGPDAVKLHREVGAHAFACGVDGLIGVGKLGREIVRGAIEAGMEGEVVVMSDEKYAAAVRTAEWTEPGDWILVKGSRGMRMEEVLDALREEME